MLFINDSKATNTNALNFALNKVSSPYELILCGDPLKEQYDSYKLLGPKKVYIFGNHAKEIDKRVIHPKKKIFHKQNLSSVMSSIKRQDYDFQTNILFSPGHPSGKDYKNFEERGNHFTQLSMSFYD